MFTPCRRLLWIAVLGSLAWAQACSSETLQAQSGTIAISVIEAGYVPARVKVKKGQPIKLVVTRKTDATCAKDIVFDEPKIQKALPLDTPVTVELTPTKAGELKYGCAMDKMIWGVLVVE